jgi:hypothetical protein
MLYWIAKEILQDSPGAAFAGQVILESRFGGDFRTTPRHAEFRRNE